MRGTRGRADAYNGQTSAHTCSLLDTKRWVCLRVIEDPILWQVIDPGLTADLDLASSAQLNSTC